MPLGMMIVMVVAIVGILALFVIWYVLDKHRFERDVEESYRDLGRLHNQRREIERALQSREINEGPMKLGGQRPRPRTPKPAYRPPSQKGRPEEGKQCNTRTF